MTTDALEYLRDRAVYGLIAELAEHLREILPYAQSRLEDMHEAEGDSLDWTIGNARYEAAVAALARIGAAP